MITAEQRKELNVFLENLADVKMDMAHHMDKMTEIQYRIDSIFDELEELVDEWSEEADDEEDSQ